MAWTCSACEFDQNEKSMDSCVACGTERPDAPQQSEDEVSETNGDVSKDEAPQSNGNEPEVVVIELPPKEKLGVKLTPPRDGVIDHGLSIDNIDNPLLENKVQSGDLIVAIGGQNVDKLGFKDAIDLIRKLPRPLAISFEIDEQRRQALAKEKRKIQNDEALDQELTTYAVVFDEGPMGLNLEEAVRYGIDGAVVRALKGQAKTSGQITVGDIVYKVNDVDVLCMPYNDVMQVLRQAQPPKTLQFVPKDKLADVQRVNSRHSESFRIRASSIQRQRRSGSHSSKMGSDTDDSKTIAQLIMDNQAATIKKGRMYKQARLMRQWKSRYFVLSVSKIEYFKNPSATQSRGVLSFLNHRCTVRSLPATNDVVCKAPHVTAQFLLELRVDDRRLVMACTSESDKKGWMDAIKLAIDASKTVGRTLNTTEQLAQLHTLRSQRTDSMDMDSNSNLLDRRGGGRLSQFNYEAFSTPVVHCTVVSATNLAKENSSVNCMCEVTVGAETFKTSVVRNKRSPVWRQDNFASFEAPDDDMVVEIRVFDMHVFKPTELLATLTIPLKSLPNMEKTTKKYPLALGNRSSGGVLTLALEYINKALAYEEEQQRDKLAEELKNSEDQMVKLKTEAAKEADEANEYAGAMEEKARILLEEAHRKAEAAMAAAKTEQEQGRAAVEKAMAEAAKAKEEADKQEAEARRAQEEAQKLIEANQRIQQEGGEGGYQEPTQFAKYRRMISDGTSREDVQKVMETDGVDESSINAFFDGINSYDAKIQALQDEVNKLKSNKSKRQKEEKSNGPSMADRLAQMDISDDQAKLLRRLLKLEKLLNEAGIAVGADIPYEEAKEKVEEIAKRMQEIGSADVTHPDPAVQQELREEYYRLEQDMEKYNNAMMMTDEYAQEQERKEREWEEENLEANKQALYAVRRMMPVEVKNLSEKQLQALTTPNGQKFPRDVALKFKRTNILELLRMKPEDIGKSHPSLLVNMRYTGLTVTERRALHLHLKDVAAGWEAQQGEELTKKKYDWFKTLKETFKTVVNTYNKHVQQYGPADNHPYATRDDPDIGCPMLGKQCPIKADRSPAYDQDFGFPDGDVYMESAVEKGAPDDQGKKAMEEAKALAREKAANVRSDLLKAHYKNVRLAAEANGVCESIDTSLDQIESKQLQWFQTRLKHRVQRTESAATIKVELAEFGGLVNDQRLMAFKFSERSGMNLKGKRDPSKDGPDTRSALESKLCSMFCEALLDCLKGMEDRMDDVKAEDKRLRAAIPTLRSLLEELEEKNQATMKDLGGGEISGAERKLKLRTELMKEAKDKNAAESAAESGGGEEQGGGEERAPAPGRGRGRGGRGGLLAGIQGRGKPEDDEGGGGGGDLMSAIRGGGRGRGRGRGGGERGGLMAAIAARGGGGDGDGGDGGGEAGGRGGLMAAIAARGRGGGGGRGGGDAGGRGGLMAAIAARGGGGD